MDKSFSSESSASKSISFVPKSSSSSDDSCDQDAFTVEKSYLSAEEPPLVAHSPNAELPNFCKMSILSLIYTILLMCVGTCELVTYTTFFHITIEFF